MEASLRPNYEARDMRSWIAELDAAQELIRIARPVDPPTEMGALGRAQL